MAKQYSVTRMIDAPRDRVWELLTDATSYKDWNAAVVSIVGPIVVGNTIELVSVASPKRTFKPKVSAMEPPVRMVWSDGMPRAPHAFMMMDAVEPAADRVLADLPGDLAGVIMSRSRDDPPPA